MRIQVVVNESGNVIAAAHVGAAGDGNTAQTGFYPHPGQKMFELDVPPALRAMEPRDRLYAVLQHRVHADGKRLEPLTKK